MKKLIFFLPIALILIVVAILVVNNADKSVVNDSNKVSIVAAENFYGQIAREIGRSYVNVTNILSNPNQDPHEYEATSEDARNISDGDIIVESGAGYDPFMDSILSTITASNKKIINVAKLVGKTENDNPHIWYDLNTIKIFAASLRDQLIQVDSLNEAQYHNGYNNFIASFGNLEELCDQVKIDFGGTRVIAIERVADYMLTNCGLIPIKNDFQKAIEEETDPSVEAINFFENSLKSHDAKVLIYNNQTESELTAKEKLIAQGNNIPVVGVTETMPTGQTYTSWMQSQLEDLHNALHE